MGRVILGQALAAISTSVWVAASAGAVTHQLAPPQGTSRWQFTGEIRGAAGYKDNVLLGHQQREGSPFWMTGLDLGLLRLPGSGPEVSLFFMGEDIRYLTAKGTDHEQVFFVVAEGKQDWPTGWGGRLGLQYYYLDQVFDASTTELGLGTIQARGHSLSLRPMIRRRVYDSIWVESELVATRQYMDEPLGDSLDLGTRWTVRHTYGSRSEWALSYEITRRDYDTRPQLDAEGYPLADTTLNLLIQRAELNWRHTWDRARRWQSQARLGAELNADTGSGYYDYTRYLTSGRLRFAPAGWEIRVEAKVSYYDYELQQVTEGDPSRRSRLTFLANARIEKYLGTKVKAFCEYEYEQALSNLAVDRFRVNTASAGLGWEW